MNSSNLCERIHTWLKPGMTILLGMILIFRPDSMTALIGTVVGFLLALIGCGLILSLFFDHRRDGLRLAAAIVVMVLGFSVIRYPLSLASQLGRFIGIALVLQSIRGLIGSVPGKTLLVVTGTVGLVLMLVPITTSRLIAVGCGILVLIVGIGMLLEACKNNHREPDNIIDAL